MTKHHRLIRIIVWVAMTFALLRFAWAVYRVPVFTKETE